MLSLPFPKQHWKGGTFGCISQILFTILGSVGIPFEKINGTFPSLFSHFESVAEVEAPVYTHNLCLFQSIVAPIYDEIDSIFKSLYISLSTFNKHLFVLDFWMFQ